MKIFVQWYDFCQKVLDDACEYAQQMLESRITEVQRFSSGPGAPTGSFATTPLFSQQKETTLKYFKRVYIGFNTFLPFGTPSCAMGRGHVVSQLPMLLAPFSPLEAFGLWGQLCQSWRQRLWAENTRKEVHCKGHTSPGLSFRGIVWDRIGTTHSLALF